MDSSFSAGLPHLAHTHAHSHSHSHGHGHHPHPAGPSHFRLHHPLQVPDLEADVFHADLQRLQDSFGHSHHQNTTHHAFDGSPHTHSAPSPVHGLPLARPHLPSQAESPRLPARLGGVGPGAGLSAAPHGRPSIPELQASAPPPPNGHARGQFGILTPTTVPSHGAVVRIQQEEEDDGYAAATQGSVEAAGGDGPGQQARSNSQLSTKIVVNPPNLRDWREKLFNVDEMIILSHEEFETYFPHIDNVYSHRSTQKYKRKPFVSHYWDCRMKGRPPGTPKSDDPNKKKRKRHARERDLCDVKIKITEYFAGATLNMLDMGSSGEGMPSLPPSTFSSAGTDGQRFWTIQRVNGNGGNGKGDGVAGPHKHTLEKSDEIKKSSVQRWVASQEKEAKKTQKAFQRKPTGAAGVTAKKHLKDSDMKLYAACFCPFSQRVWIALEAKGLPYQYCEIDPFKKPQQLLEANPRGLVPAIRKGDWACGESAVILEYLEDLDSRIRLYPTEPRLKANCRLWIDHINSRIVPSFYYLLHAGDPEKQNEGIEKLQYDITALVQAADEQGPYFLGPGLCLVDIHFAPFAIRLSSILKPLREWTDAAPGTRWQQWVDALENNHHVQATTSNRELYIETMELLLNSRQVHGDSQVTPRPGLTRI